MVVEQTRKYRIFDRKPSDLEIDFGGEKINTFEEQLSTTQTELETVKSELAARDAADVFNSRMEEIEPDYDLAAEDKKFLAHVLGGNHRLKAKRRANLRGNCPATPEGRITARQADLCHGDNRHQQIDDPLLRLVVGVTTFVEHLIPSPVPPRIQPRDHLSGRR